MFQQFKNIETAFHHVRLFSFVLIAASMATCCFAILESFRLVRESQQRIYVLVRGKALEAIATDRKGNIPVEARDHVKMFHYYFFTLDPDMAVIERNIGKALYLSGGVARKQYNDLRESGYYARIVSGNVSQRVEVDSILVDTRSYPYRFRYYGKQTIIRSTSLVKRILVTEGAVREISRSDNNPHGFLIEEWKILENRNLQVEKR